MRFDDFVAQQRIEVLGADRFLGYAVDVVLPPDWQPFDAASGVRVWVWSEDPRKTQFGVNTVSTCIA